MNGREIVIAEGVVCRMRKHRRSRHVRIIVRRDGSVLLTLPFFVSYCEGERFLVERVDWIKAQRAESLKYPEQLLLAGSKKEYQEKSIEARELIEKRLAYFQPMYGFRWGVITVRNQKTRWGSCSRLGNLSFNYRLIYLPERLRDYIIVHELCHLGSFDHSPRFWQLVAQQFPDYREMRRMLRML